ncbi:hypothetical protein EGI22_07245 [Lacihabitans sp. LS3-19]|uniref:3-coathanger stack domain-containing protein n=1 Tax=Lacihabitans sp. LS3-19 TaxID=2487335 RepID=UPI0020CCC887|nr:3-coathanger stack domain-containing protein [Lacihabitans sp. LS3-19]MCP9767703.1 hypothetical protein [Lacihabitans sp. LS3-19]
MKRGLFLAFFLFSFSKVLSQITIAQQDFETLPAVPAWNYSVSGTGDSILSGVLANPGKPLNANLFNGGSKSFGTLNGNTLLDFDPINTTYLKNLKIEFKLASYSITTANGADASDYVEVLFSTDGINFYKEIEVKGFTTGNSWWGFNGTGLASRYYSGVGNFGTFTATKGGENLDGYSSIVLTDLPSVPNLYFRVSLKNNSPGELWLIDEIKLTGEDNTSPTLLTTKKSISDINYLVNNGPSLPLLYQLSGINLDPSVGNVGVKAPHDFEISLEETLNFSDSITVTYSDGYFGQTAIYVRLKANLAIGLYGGTGFNIVNSGGGASNLNIKLDGKVSDGLSCGIITDIDTVRNTLPPLGSYTGLTIYTIKGQVTGVFGSSKFYLQDSTGGIAVYQTNIVSNYSLKIGDWVSLSGTPTRFNGESEIVSITCFDKIAGGIPILPLVFDANNPPIDTSFMDFLKINEGRIVKEKGVNILNIGTYSSASNYNLSACNNQGFSEIRVDAGAVSIIGSAIPTVTQDITGIVGRFINAGGTTDKMQLFPRLTSDFQESTYPCVSTSGCGVTTYSKPVDKFDVFNWNLEWLGNPTFGPSQSGVDDNLQIANCQTVLNAAHSDLYMLQEICSYNASNPEDNTTAFGKLIEGLNTEYGSGTYTGECSSSYSYSYLETPDPFGQRVCVIYNKNIVRKIFSRPMFENLVLEDYPPTGLATQFWASGRKPFQFMAEIDLSGKKDTVLFVGLHAKSGSDLEAFERRKFDVKVLYDSLQVQFPSRKIMIIGDLNDDLDQSIYAGGHASTYAPFLHQNPEDTLLNSKRPNVLWNPITKLFSDIGCSSTSTFSDYIDHQIISYGFGDKETGLKYIPNSVTSFRPPVHYYSTTTSDHYATISQYEYFSRPVLSPCDNIIVLDSPSNDFDNIIGDVIANKINGKIVVTNKVFNLSNIKFVAPSIELSPGFVAENGVVFKAEVGGCD